MTIIKGNGNCSMDHSVYELLMEHALIEATKGFEEGEVPIGAVIADPDGNIISKAHNQPITLNDPTAHAEIMALRKAGPSGSSAINVSNYTLAHVRA